MEEKVFKFLTDIKETINCDEFLKEAQEIVDEGSMSLMLMDLILAKFVLTDANLYGLKEDDGPYYGVNLYTRITDGFDYMRKVVDFVAHNDSVNFPMTRDRMIEIMVSNRQCVCMNGKYGLTTSSSVDRFSELEMVAYMAKCDLDMTFYRLLLGELKRHRCDDASMYMENYCNKMAEIQKKGKSGKKRKKK